MEHGSEEMYRKHLRGGEDPCDSCKAAHAEYVAGYRLIKGRDRSKDTQRATVRRRALVRLGREYPERLEELIFDEYLNLGASK